MARGWTKNAVITDYIPSDANDLVRYYEPFVARLVTRYNRVHTNYKDLLQHVWLKLFEVNIIGKYQRSGTAQPKMMTAAEACSHLGMSFQSFKKAIHRHQVGDDRVADALRAPTVINKAVFERDKGCCWRCGQDMDRLQRALTAMRAQEKLRKKDRKNPSEFQGLLVEFGVDFELKISLKPRTSKYQALRQTLKEKYGITAWHRNLWIAERTPGTFNRTSADSYRTTCLFCLHAMNPVSSRVRRKSEWAPTPSQGGYASQKATYRMEDIERFKSMREESAKKKTALVPVKSTALALPTTPKRTLFKLYLARAVHNIYANWCRTRSRRYKEEYRGNEEDGSPWESFLEDSHAIRPDDMVDLYHTSKLLVSGEEDIRDVDMSSKDHEAAQEKLLTLLSEGYSLPEAAQKLALPQSVLKVVAGF
jgi:DNA-directed RNA polymerase specialized sigma24 family protein